MSSRREILYVASSVVTLSSVSGCLGSLEDGRISVRIENRSDQQHTVRVVFEDGDETAFSEQYSVRAGEDTTTDEVVAAGEYVVTIELDSSATTTVDFNMAGCDSNTLFVSIVEGGELEASILDEC